MILVKPSKISPETLAFADKVVIGSNLSHAQWMKLVPDELRLRAWFVSRMENARMIQSLKDWTNDAMQGITEKTASGQTVLKVGGRARFVDLAQKRMASIGIERTTGDVRDHTSQSRLDLIFNTQTQQAQDYGNWKQGQDPDVLNEFPAQRFIREHAVRVPRRYHQLNVGRVELKSNLKFWISMNPDFGVPFGPWGFNSGMGVEDVDRDEAERMGLIKPGEQAQPVDKKFNEDLQASTQGLDPEMIDQLKAEFGNRVEFNSGTASWAWRMEP